MQRRDLISLATAWLMLSPSETMAAPRHPFAKLIDLDTVRHYRPDPQKFTLAVFMTAQQNYASCGEAFIGVRELISMLGAQDKIDPILVMPRSADQPDPSDLRNLAKAQQYKMRVLTGALPDVLAAAYAVGASFQIDSQRKVVGHEDPPRAYFLTSRGETLAHHPANDYLGFLKDARRLMNACQKPENTSVCFG